MKKIYTLIFPLFFITIVYSQTNTFPDTGKVGIGTLSPVTKLHLTKTLGASNAIENLLTIDAEYGSATGVGFGGGILFRGRTVGNANLLHAQVSSVQDAPENNQFGLSFYTTPTASSLTERLRITSIGNVGLGTSAPNNRLSVNGNSDFGATSYGYVGPSQYGGVMFPRGQILFSNTNAQNQLYLVSNGYVNSGGNFAFRQSGSAAGIGIDDGAVSIITASTGTADGTISFKNAFYVENSGNIGIGTTAPSEKLSVNGNISTKKLMVTQLGWSDYVFNKDFKLRSLSSLEAFIKQNKHLPEVPSAKEVEEKGISVGDNQALLLKKIEELTLYLIQQQKQIAQQQTEIAEMRREMHSLKGKNTKRR